MSDNPDRNMEKGKILFTFENIYYFKVHMSFRKANESFVCSDVVHTRERSDKT
jgi:hypothetical protein